MAPKIHVGPNDPEHLIRAVRGRRRASPCALDEAEARRLGRRAERPAGAAGVACAGSSCPRRASSRGWSGCDATPDVQFTSAAGAYATQVAELALGLLIAGVRGFAHYARVKTWDPRPERTLEGSTVAIVGAGGIGRALIDMLEPHDVEVLAVTRSGRDGTLPVDRIDEIWSQGGPLRDRRARHRRDQAHRRRGRAGGDAGPFVDRQHRPRLADRHRRARRRAARGSAAPRSTSPTRSRSRTATRCGARRTC